ncbi:unnamed protein product [Tilletia controversa]|nr:unnamed protein product [Tilletia controversa]CAD6937811.1 unnamed protein product [Tilletia controversa]CAD6980757.1 unnamed protein product [Tilletia controversa]CAD6986435.1 unnamed protein product [Tilletia controversa]
MAAPRNSALALASIMSPAPPSRGSQKRKADEAGMELYAGALSLDALSAAAAVAASTGSAPSNLHSDSGRKSAVMLGEASRSMHEASDAGPGYRPSQANFGAPPIAQGSAYFMDGNDEGHYEDDGGIIRCICGCDDDDGFTVQCDRCLVWQHCACLKMTPDSLPDEYLCEQCFPRPIDVEFARSLQQRRRQEEARKELQEQQLSTSVRRTSAAQPSAQSATPSIMSELGIATGSLSSAKDNRGRKSSQSEHVASEVDYFSTSMLSSSAAAASSSAKYGKRKTSTSVSKSSKKPPVPVPVAAPEPPPPPPVITPKEPRPREPDEDFLDAQERFEAWHIEYTPVPSNIYSDQHTKASLNAIINDIAAPPKLRAFEVGTGKVMAPLADPAEDELDPSEPMPRAFNELQTGNGVQGMSIVGNECVPVEIEAASLADIAQRSTVRYIPEGVAAGMFAQIQSAEASPATPHHAWSSSNNIPRPTMHGLYTDVAISAGTFIGEYRGEIASADAYRADPINQYAALGTTKPHVHILPPPMNIAIDARRYGTETRFARPSCHPNSVLRPIVLRAPTNDEAPAGEPKEDASSTAAQKPKEETEMLFGLFAVSDINRGHEITLGWEWDDLHIVHFLPELVKEPPRISRRAVSPAKDVVPEPITFPYAGTPVAAKMDAVTSAICSVTLCACLGPASSNSSSAAAAAATYINPTQLTQSNLRKQDCALAQMVRVAHGMELLQVIPSAKSHRKMRPPDFAPLVSRRRWWRPLPMPLTPSDSTKTEDRSSGRPALRANGLASDDDRDIEMAEDASGRTRSDEEIDDGQRSEASSLTEPLSESFDMAPPMVSEEAADASLSVASDEKPETVAEDDEDRPTILPLKKRIAGTRLKATYFDADFASDNSDEDADHVLSKSAAVARKPGGRMRTVSRSTRIAKDPRRRPLRSTPDLEDESDNERRTAKAARKIKQKRDAKLLGQIRKPKKDAQPSSPLSSLSSQASLSSLESDTESESGSGSGSGSGSEGDESSVESSDEDSDDSSDSSGSDSDSDSSSEESSSASVDPSSRRGEKRPAKKSSFQEKARKRAAKFRADIAALGDADSSSDDSAIPAGQRKKASKKGKGSDEKAKSVVAKEKEKMKEKEKSRLEKEKIRLEKKKAKKAEKAARAAKAAKQERDKRKKVSQTTSEREAGEVQHKDKKAEKKSAPKDRKADESAAEDESLSPVRPRKTKPASRAIASSSESDVNEQAPVKVKKPVKSSATLQEAAAHEPVSPTVAKVAAPVPPPAQTERPIEQEPAATKADPPVEKAAGTTATLPPPPTAVEPVAPQQSAPPKTGPPQAEAPRKKLSLADYKKRLAEKKVVEPVIMPAIPETPAPETGPAPVPASSTDIVEKSEEPAALPKEVPASPVAVVEVNEVTPAIVERPIDPPRTVASPVKSTAPSPPTASASSTATPMQFEHSDRRSARPGDRGWSRVSSPSRDEEPDIPMPPRQPSIESSHRPPHASRWADPAPEVPRISRPTMLTGANAAPADHVRDRDTYGSSTFGRVRPFTRPVPASPSEDRMDMDPPTFGRGRPFSRPVPPSPSEDRMDIDPPPRYGGAIPSADSIRRDSSPTRPEHGSRPSLGSAWQAVGSERPRFSSRAPEPSMGVGFRPATTVASSPESGRPELSIAGRAAASASSNRLSAGGSSSIPTGPAGLHVFNPPRGPRALMGSSIMAAPAITAPAPTNGGSVKDSTSASTAAPAPANPAPPSAMSLSTSTPLPPGPARLSGANALAPPATGNIASGSNKISGPQPSASTSGWTRISASSNPPAASASSSSTPAFISDRVTPSSTPASIRADLMNFEGVPKGPASMRGESSGSSSYDDYEYFGGRDRGRGGWRGPRVRKRGGGRGRGWGMRP